MTMMWPLSLVLLMAAAVATGPVETILFQSLNSSIAPEQLRPRLFDSEFSLKVNSSATAGKPTPLLGNPVKPGQIPWHVSLWFPTTVPGLPGYPLTMLCSGALISPHAVLTIATCLYDSKTGQLYRPESELLSLVKVRSGSNHLGTSEASVQMRDISKIIKLNKFGTTNPPQYNLAIVKVSKPFKEDANTKPIPWAVDKVALGRPCSVSGWGFQLNVRADLRADLHLDLRTSVEQMADTDQCKDYLGIPMGKIIDLRCTRRATSACEGDFGGPVVCDGKLAGIAAGADCKYDYGPFTATDVHSDWIKENAAATTSIPIGVFVSAFLLIVFQQAAL